MLRSYHSASAPEKALRRPSVATLYPGNMTFEPRECPAATSGTRRRLTKLLVKRKTSSDVPPCQGRMCAQEVACVPVRGSFPGCIGASRRPGGRCRGGCCQRPRRDVLRSQENNGRRKDADVSYQVSRRASLRREIVAGEQEPNGAGRRRRRDARGLFMDSGSPPRSLTRGMEIDWNAPAARTRARLDERVRSRWSSRIAHH